MKQQNPNYEEKFLGHTAWFSVFIGVTVLIQSLHPLFEEYSTTVNVLFVIAFLGSFIMFCLKGGLKSKKLFVNYQDEFLRSINTTTYKHSAFALMGAFILASIFSGNILVNVSHASMALAYVGVGSISYGFSLIWQSRA